MDERAERFGIIIRLDEARVVRDRDQAVAKLLLLFNDLKKNLATLNVELDELKKHLHESGMKGAGNV